MIKNVQTPPISSKTPSEAGSLKEIKDKTPLTERDISDFLAKNVITPSEDVVSYIVKKVSKKG